MDDRKGATRATMLRRIPIDAWTTPQGFPVKVEAVEYSTDWGIAVVIGGKANVYDDTANPIQTEEAAIDRANASASALRRRLGVRHG